MTGIYTLDPANKCSSFEIGGKAYNLNRMLEADLLVPGGFVLSVSFFENWHATLHHSPEWSTLAQAQSENEIRNTCEKLQRQARNLDFNEHQLHDIQVHLQAFDPEQLFSVRSSSPHEDLEASSFAGAYESVLGVTTKSLHAAIRRVFASCLDPRIALYKRQLGITIDSPKIAVIVQQQIASEKAGVGFSLNPLNNDYDEAVFNANWGQGETVVSGLCSPDFFIVHKDSLQIVETRIGAKEISIWLEADGGTTERQDARYQARCLNDKELIELTEQLKRVESFFDQPTDIEWSIAEGKLFLLQARPITTYHPLPRAMQTAPGQAKHLYVDITMSVQGIFEPLSPMGLSLFRMIPKHIKDELIGTQVLAPTDRSLIVMGNGRLYCDIINLIHLAGPRKVFRVLSQMDPLVHKTISELDLAPFAKIQLRKWPLLLGFVSRFYRRLFQVVRARTHPERARIRWSHQWSSYKSRLHDFGQQSQSVLEYSEQCIVALIQFLCRETMMLFPSAKLALGKIRQLFPEPSEQILSHISRLDQALAGNVTVEMGHALYRLHTMLAPSQATDARTLLSAIESRSLSENFLSAWSDFVEQYGHRGIKEIDIASPRYRDQPQLLLQQLVEFVQRDANLPSALDHYQALQEERQTSYKFLHDQLAGPQQNHFDKQYAIVENLGGLRETHKFVAIYTFDQIRKRVLGEAKELVRQSRITQINDIFFLSFQQLDRGLAQPEVALQLEVAKGRRQFARQSQCKQALPLIDSRGRFYRSKPPPTKPGEITGQAVSPGIASGPAKVLRSPDDKPLRPGEILIARATDPAWTPLFVNAAAIVLEIGGPLQHGALVAREYGKPCVSAVQGATELFHDGELIEVDGEQGVIRRLGTKKESL